MFISYYYSVGFKLKHFGNDLEFTRAVFIIPSSSSRVVWTKKCYATAVDSVMLYLNYTGTEKVKSLGGQNSSVL